MLIELHNVYKNHVGINNNSYFNLALISLLKKLHKMHKKVFESVFVRCKHVALMHYFVALQ